MKNFKSIHKIVIALMVIFALTNQSCSSELDINEDPNNPTTVPLRTLLSSAEANLGYTLAGDGTRMPASVMQYYAGHRAQPWDYSIYKIQSSDTDGLWTRLYDVLADLKDIENKGQKSGDRVYVGISQLLQAYTFSVTTDLFGDIPFTEALKGSDNITPRYDKQEFVYNELLKLIDEGIGNIKSNSGINKPSNDDLVYGGNLNKWEMFGNSLKLRLLNHLSKKNPDLALNFLNSSPKLINSVSDNAKVPFFNTASNSNPIYQFDVLSGRKDNAVSSTIVEKLKTTNDPRLDVYFKPITNNLAGFEGQIRGNEPGDNTDDSGENLYSRVGSAYASPNSPVYLLSSAEINFIQAEVYKRANNDVSAKKHYEQAIRNDFEALGVSGVDGFLLNPDVSYNNTLKRIMEQKWVTMFQSAFESWVDWRRTGFPLISSPANNRTGGIVPRRLPYPQVEINVNRKSLEEGPGVPIPFETLKTKVWWDQ